MFPISLYAPSYPASSPHMPDIKYRYAPADFGNTRTVCRKTTQADNLLQMCQFLKDEIYIIDYKKYIFKLWNKAHTIRSRYPFKKPIKFVFLQRSNYISRHEIAHHAMNA